MPRENIKSGAAFMLACGFAFACSGALVKIAVRDLPNEMIVFFRNALGLVVLWPLLWRAGRNGLKTQFLGLHVFRALVGLAAMYCYFFAIAHLPLAIATLFTYATPLFVPLIAFIWLRERISRAFGWIIVLGFFGIVLILRPGHDFFTPVSLVALASGFFAALVAVGIRRMSRSEPATRIVFYFTAISTLVSAVPLSWAWQTPPTGMWIVLAGIALCSVAAQLFLTRAYASAQAAHVGPFVYSTVVFATLAAWLFWNEIPDAISVLGIVIVCVAGILAIRRGAAPVEPLPDRVPQR
jgi:drug/metabolite transporter (DMT)-like permease